MSPKCLGILDKQITQAKSTNTHTLSLILEQGPAHKFKFCIRVPKPISKENSKAQNRVGGKNNITRPK